MAGQQVAQLSAVGMLIKTWRGKRTQRQYAEALAISNVAVVKLERGDFLPSWRTIAAICNDAGLSDEERRAFLDLVFQVAAQPATRMPNPAANRG